MEEQNQSEAQTQTIENVQQHEPDVTQLAVHSYFRSAPLPMPEEFERYEQILPGAADRIMAMAEIQGEHRREQEKRAQDAYVRDSLLGLIFAFVFAIGALVGSIFLINNDHTVTGSFLGGTALLAVVSAFIQGRRPHKDEK